MPAVHTVYYYFNLEVRERYASSSRPALVASTTACRVQTFGSRLPLSAQPGTGISL